ncbi:matrixin family metalloprotease [Actinotalea sp. C106]|uniref:matrixin family metalloprotease n=1 Tax=Actinotalea sp. C106 TaxID=2908644 RepID=UPI002027ED80|nr:matrixin family metalloprotease [Actinotalea sp. C106]
MDVISRREHRRSRRLLRQMDRAAGRRRRARARLVLSGLVTVVVVVLAAAHLTGTDLVDLIRPRAYVEVDGRAVAVPRPVPAEGRLLPEVAVTTEGSHAFLHVDDEGEPVGYDPCRPVEYVVRTDGAPRSGPALIEEAVSVLSLASGLEIVDAGTTDEAPVMDRPLIQPERYGEAWAPVLIAWSDDSELPELEGQVAGVGGSAAVPGVDGSGRWLAAGRVALDGPDIEGLLARTGGHAEARAIVVHELAHVLGLDHVDDPTELMHPITSARTDLGPGDLQGLALLGQVECQP